MNETLVKVVVNKIEWTEVEDVKYSVILTRDSWMVYTNEYNALWTEVEIAFGKDANIPLTDKDIDKQFYVRITRGDKVYVDGRMRLSGCKGNGVTFKAFLFGSEVSVEKAEMKLPVKFMACDEGYTVLDSDDNFVSEQELNNLLYELFGLRAHKPIRFSVEIIDGTPRFVVEKV